MNKKQLSWAKKYGGIITILQDHEKRIKKLEERLNANESR